MKQTIYIILFLFLVFIVFINNRKKLKSQDISARKKRKTQNISTTNNKHTDKTIFPRDKKQLEKDLVFDEDYQYPEFNNVNDKKPFSVKSELYLNKPYVAGGINVDLYKVWAERQQAVNEKYANTPIPPPILWRPPKR